MGVSQVVNLLKIATNQLSSVQYRYQTLQEHNNRLESIIKTRSKDLQYLNDEIISSNKNLDTIKSEYRREAALLQGLQQHTARLEGFVYNYKNNNEEYIKLMENIENKVHDYLSDKKKILNAAIISIIESMRNNPEKYSVLVYHNNDNQNSSSSTRRQALVVPPPPYDDSIIEYYKGIMLEEAEKLYNDIVDQVLCEVVSENVANQSTGTMPSSLPALPLEEG
jgi:chromosome segregation ATPase